MVERESAAAAAVDAPPAVAGEERSSGNLPLHRPRHPDVVDEADHMRSLEGRGGRMERQVVLLQDFGLALEHEDVCAPNRADVQRLVARVQDENLLHLREM